MDRHACDDAPGRSHAVGIRRHAGGASVEVSNVPTSVSVLTIRNAQDLARRDRNRMAMQVTWVPGAIQPHSSMWITMQRLLVLNRPSSEDFFHTFAPSNRPGVRSPSLDPIKQRGKSNTISLLRVARVLRESVACFSGAQVFQYPAGIWPIFGDHLVWCPQCLDEGFHSILFSLRGLQRCPIHGLNLKPTLPCGHRIGHGALGSSLLRPGRCGQCGLISAGAYCAQGPSASRARSAVG